MTSITPAVGLGTPRGGGTIVGQDEMNLTGLTGVIPIGTNPPMDTTRTEEDPYPGLGTPDPTLVIDAAAMTAAQTGQVQPQLVFILEALIYYVS